MGVAAKTSSKGKRKPASVALDSSSATAGAKAKSSSTTVRGGGGSKAAQLESKLALLAGAGPDTDGQPPQQQQQPEKKGKSKKGVKAAVAAAAAASDSDGGDKMDQDTPAAVDPSTSADFVALSTAVQGKLKRQEQQPRASKPKQQGQQAGGAAVKAAAREGRILYLGHVPHGFYEEQMRGFFAQFGDVNHVRLSRSKKTAKSRGYAFLEFADPEVAAIVAETMDGYYLSGRKLVCHALEPAKAHPGLFDDADKAWRVIPWRRLERERRAEPKTERDARKCLSRLLRGDGRRRKKLAQLGIDYAFAGYEAEAHLAAVRQMKDGPDASTKALKALPAAAEAAAASKKRKGKDEEGAAAAAEGVEAAAAKGGEGKKGGKKTKLGAGGGQQVAEQRKAGGEAAASKKRPRAEGVEAAKPKAAAPKIAKAAAGKGKKANGK